MWRPPERAVTGEDQVGIRRIVRIIRPRFLRWRRRWMDDKGFEAWRKSGDLRGPVREQRGRGHEKARFASHPRLVFQHQQQRQHLNGLAKPLGKALQEYAGAKKTCWGYAR